MYKLVKVNENYAIVRISDNAGIPKAGGNRDYKQFLQDIKDNDMSIVEGADIVSPDYVSLRRGDDGYSRIGEQLDMQYKNDGSWEAHILDVKTRHPKSNAGSTVIEAIPAWVQEEVDKL